MFEKEAAGIVGEAKCTSDTYGSRISVTPPGSLLHAPIPQAGTPSEPLRPALMYVV